jgi:hypothetical protein
MRGPGKEDMLEENFSYADPPGGFYTIFPPWLSGFRTTVLTMACSILLSMVPCPAPVPLKKKQQLVSLAGFP